MSAPQEPDRIEAPGSRKIKELELMVSDIRLERPDTTTISLFTGNDRLEYEAGHFLTIDPHQFDSLGGFIGFLEDVKGKREPARAYSLASAPHERHLTITVKEERYVAGVTLYPPLLSPFLVGGLSRGARLVVTGFTGPYTLPLDVESQTDHIVHLCAGSGAVPNFSILKHALKIHPSLRHTFICSNRTRNDVAFLDELDSLERRHPEHVRVIHTLTREIGSNGDSRFRQGRVSLPLLKELIPEPSACLVYACGPAVSVWDRRRAKEEQRVPEPRFMENVMQILDEIGVQRDRIRKESFG